MVPSLRGRLVCFYCGCRSAQTRKPDIRRWQCEKCEAVNHLDENGDITDPPASETTSNARYAQSSQPPSAPDQSLFCAICLKNQHLFSETLAGYFPPQDAPDYAEYEKQYPKYRRELEARYPQVCEVCEPKVQERIRATGYAAKTDHLRRMMERTRDGGGNLAYARSNWKSILIFAGGAGWFTSLFGQVAWDVLALWALQKETAGFIDGEPIFSNSRCLGQLMRGSEVSPGCATLVDPLARYSLLLGLLSIWWNPKARERLNRNGGRMIGVGEYYKLQAILLVARCIALWYLAGSADSMPNRQMKMGIHWGVLFFGTLITTMSFRTIGIDYTARVLFQDPPEPLVPQRSQVHDTSTGPAMPHNNAPQPQLNSQAIASNSSRLPFSINDLAPASERQYRSPHQSTYRPPTPPPEDDDYEAMDWTPSQYSTLRPSSLLQSSSTALQQQQQQQQPNPFRGHLPPDIVSMEHRIRNPPNKPTFRKASETQKQNFFRNPKQIASRDLDYLSDTATEYEPSITESTFEPTPARKLFADPKLRLPSDRQAVTGLESILSRAFTLDDEPPEIRVRHQQQARAQAIARSDIKGHHGPWHRLPVIILLVAACFVWKNTLGPSVASDNLQIRLATLLISGLASVRSIAILLQQDSNYSSGSDMVIFITELLASVALATVIREPSADSLSAIRPGALVTAGFTLMAFMAAQEMWIFGLDLWTAWSNSERSAVGDYTPTTAPDPITLALPSIAEIPSPTEDKRFAQFQPKKSITQPPMEVARRSTRLQMEQSPSTGTGFRGLSLGGTPSNAQRRRGNRDGMW